MLKTEPFELYAAKYDAWFDKYPFVFKSELEALRAGLPYGDISGIEVGLGTGRFAKELGIKEGVEPARSMRMMALARGVEVLNGTAERLPYKDLHFDFVLMASCISYFNMLAPAFREANRVLKKGGSLVVGFIEKDSIIGKEYEAKRQTNVFYKQALFYSADRVAEEIKKAGFNKLEFSQTLFKKLDEINEYEPAEPGHGKGSFVVIKAIKK